MIKRDVYTSWSAPIPIVISGELGERFGKPLLACAMDYRVICNINDAKRQKVKNSDVLHIEYTLIDYLTRKAIPFQVRPYHLELQHNSFFDVQQIHPAAIVTTVAALLDFLTGKNFSPDEINTISFNIMKKKNRPELGYRSSAACFGGLIYARREFEFLKIITRLPFKMPPSFTKKLFFIPARKYINNSEVFAGKYNEHVAEIESYLQQFEKNTRKMTVAIASENKKLFSEALINNHEIHKKLHLTENTEIVFSDRKPAGGFPFKISYTGVAKITGQKPVS